MASLRYDPENPPAEPPDGCADHLLWRVAHALHRAHLLASDNRCSCGEPFPCPRSGLAARGMLTACLRQPIDPDPSNPPYYYRRWSRRSI